MKETFSPINKKIKTLSTDFLNHFSAFSEDWSFNFKE